jgi:hypothetical protein
LLGCLKSSRQLLLTWEKQRFGPFAFASMQNGQWRVLADTSDVVAVLMNG